MSAVVGGPAVGRFQRGYLLELLERRETDQGLLVGRCVEGWVSMRVLSQVRKVAHSTEAAVFLAWVALRRATRFQARQTGLRVFRVLVRELGVYARRLAWERYQAQSHKALLPPPPDQMDITVTNQWHEEHRQEQPAWMASWSSVAQRLQQMRHQTERNVSSVARRPVPIAPVSPPSSADAEVSTQAEPTDPTAPTAHTEDTGQAQQSADALEKQKQNQEALIQRARTQRTGNTEQAADKKPDKRRQDQEALLQRAREVEAALREAQASVRDERLPVGVQSRTAAHPPSGRPDVVGVWKAEGVLADGISAVVEHFELVPHADGNIVGAGYEASMDDQSEPSRFANVTLQPVTEDGRWEISMHQIFENSDKTIWTAELLWTVDDGWTMVNGQWTSPAPAKKTLDRSVRAPPTVREFSHQPWTDDNGDLTHGNQNIPAHIGRRKLLTSSTSTYSPPNARSPRTARSPSGVGGSASESRNSSVANADGGEVQGSFSTATVSVELAERVRERLADAIDEVLQLPSKLSTRKRKSASARSTQAYALYALADSSRASRFDQRTGPTSARHSPIADRARGDEFAAEGEPLPEDEFQNADYVPAHDGHSLDAVDEVQNLTNKLESQLMVLTGQLQASLVDAAHGDLSLEPETSSEASYGDPNESSQPGHASSRGFSHLQPRSPAQRTPRPSAMRLVSTTSSPNSQGKARVTGRRRDGEASKRLQQQQMLAQQRALIKKKEAEQQRQAVRKQNERKGRRNGTPHTATPARSDLGPAQQSTDLAEVSPADASKHFEQSLRSSDDGREQAISRKEQTERRQRELLAQKAALEAKMAAKKTLREEVAMEQTERRQHELLAQKAASEAKIAARMAARKTLREEEAVLSTAVQHYDPEPEPLEHPVAEAIEDAAPLADGRSAEMMQPTTTHTDVDEEERSRLATEEAERARKRAIREMAIRRQEEAELQREEAERAAAPSCVPALALALPNSASADGEIPSPTSAMSAASSEMSEAGVMTAQICNTAMQTAINAASAFRDSAASAPVEPADAHADVETSRSLPSDNATGFAGVAALSLADASDAIVSAAFEAADVVLDQAGIGGSDANAARDSEFLVDKSIPNVGVLTVTVLSGKDLASEDRVGKSDPYVMARAGNANTAVTSIIYNTFAPEWSEPGSGDLVLNVQSVDDVVVLECYDSDRKGADKTTAAGRAQDDKMGVAFLTVKDLMAADRPVDVALFDPTAKKASKKHAGALSLTAKWSFTEE